MRQAQITLFVIIGLVAIILITFMFAIRSTLEQRVGETEKIDYVGFDNSEGTLKSHVSDCLASVTRNAISTIGLHAGYIDALPVPFYGESGNLNNHFYDGNFIPIAASRTGSQLLPLEDVSKRICRMAYIDMASCVNLDFFLENGYDTYSEVWSTDYNLVDMNCNATVKPDSVAIKVIHPVALRKGEYFVNVTDFVALVSTTLGQAYIVADYLTVNGADAYSGITPYSFQVDCTQIPSTFALQTDGPIVQLVGTASTSNNFIFQFGLNDFSLEGNCVI